MGLKFISNKLLNQLRDIIMIPFFSKDIKFELIKF